MEHKQTIVLRKDLDTRVSGGFRYGRYPPIALPAEQSK
jgi:hypothetical protein